MPKPTTRQDSKINTSRRSKTPPRRTVVNPNLIDLSVSGKGRVRVSTRAPGRGRGSTPLKRGSLASGSIASQSSTSIRAIRASPVSCSLDSYQTGATDSNADFDNNLLSKSTSTIDTEPLEDSSVNTLGEITVKPNISSEMPDEERSRETDKQSTNGSTMENLMAYFQEAMKSTQDEFRRELASLRDSLGESNNNQPSGSQTNASYGSFSPNFKLKDWKISYSGDSSVSDFLFKLGTLVERSQCPHDHLLSNFHIFLTGKGETFYWDYIRQHQRATYPMLRTALSKEFGSRESDHEILLKISARKQLPKESYDDFHSFIVRWNLRLTNPMSDASLIEILKKNVNADLKIMLFISDPKDLGSLRDLARKAEKVLAENKNITPSRQRHVNEISVETTPIDTEFESDPQIEALKINRTWTPGDYSKIKCWNCLQLGHSYIYCPDENRHIFCYKCGKRGVTTVKCDVPHAGNRRRSEWATGDARSSK